VAEKFDLSSLSLDRRSFLRRGALGGAGAVLLAGGGMSALLAACGSSSKSSSSGTTTATTTASGTPNYGELNFQLSWVKDVEFAGEYIADTNGYYKQVGFSGVNLLTGGPDVQQDAVVASGKALACISSPDITSAAINNGADLVTIGAQYQKNPFAIMSLAKSPIKNPQDMIGKKIGVQATNNPVWDAFLKANNIDPTKIDKVVVQFDPSPLAQGTVDGWFAFITNEPNLLAAKGVKTYTFLLNDFGYPLVSETYVVRRSTIASSRDEIKALLKAEIMGWQQALKNPALGAQLTVDTYGKSLGNTVPEQTLESISQNKLIVSPDTQANGIFTLTPTIIAKTIRTLGLAGISITAEKLFDTSVIDEVYSENPSLKAYTVAP
jgi:ABC-type nitrate/sulfonate/bicarbonate transport system substrate-binding protein